MADRFTYLPKIGIFVLLTWGLATLLVRLSPKKASGGLLMTGAVVIMLGLFGLTRAQLQHWRSSETLFRHALAVTTKNYLAHNYLANALATQGRLEESLSHYQKSLRIHPGYTDAHNNLGYTLAQAGRHEEAEAHFLTALQQSPSHTRAANNLSLTYAAQGKYDLAEKCLSELADRKPNDPQVRFNLANTQYAQGKMAEAAVTFQRYLALNPDDIEAERQLGLALMQSGAGGEGIKHLERAAQRQPDAQSSYGLALGYTILGRHQEAIASYRQALMASPDSAVILNDLAWLLATTTQDELRNGGEAVRLAERACELTQGREARFLGTLDAAYAAAGRFSDALTTAEKARTTAIAAGQPAIAEAAQKRIALYQAGKAVRETPRASQ